MDPQQMNDIQLQKALGLTYNAKKKAEADLKELQREWLSRHGKSVGAEFDGNGVQVYLSPNARWDEHQARKALTEAGIPERIIEQMEVTVLDRKAAEEMLPPRVYRACQKASAPKFNIRFT